MNTLEIIRNFQPVFWILGGVVVLKVFVEFMLPILIKDWKRERKFKQGSKWRKNRDRLTWLRGLSPKEFEDYIADLFNKLGYKTQVVGGGYDKGVDVVAEKDSLKHYIQCKKYITSVVGVSDLRDFYGAIADHLAQAKGYFITTNKFTLEAERFAEDKPIELIDGYKLINYIRLTEKNSDKGDSKVCPKCGGKLEEKIGKYGKFLGCSNYPKCKYTKNILR